MPFFEFNFYSTVAIERLQDCTIPPFGKSYKAQTIPSGK